MWKKGALLLIIILGILSCLSTASATVKIQEPLLEDSCIHSEQVFETVVKADWAEIVSFPKYSWYELSLNHYDPRWGLNPHDPRELYAHEDSFKTKSYDLMNILFILVGYGIIQQIKTQK